MGLKHYLRDLKNQLGIHPMHWWRTLFSYSRYMGYIKPELAREASPEAFLARLQTLAQQSDIKHLSVPVGQKILVIAPHPDDETIGAGGLLLAHKDQSELHILTVCNGQEGGALPEPESDPEQARQKMIACRKAELSQVAEQLGATVHTLGYADGQIPATQEAADKMRAVVDAIQPDVILLPWFLDHLRDHQMTNVLFAWGCSELTCMVLAYEIWSLLAPNAVFDITAQIEAKRSLIQHYKSQLQTVDYLGYADGLSKVRAYQHAVRQDRSGSAEAFLSLPVEDYAQWVKHLYGTPDAFKNQALA